MNDLEEFFGVAGTEASNPEDLLECQVCHEPVRRGDAVFLDPQIDLEYPVHEHCLRRVLLDKTLPEPLEPWEVDLLVKHAKKGTIKVCPMRQFGSETPDE